METYEKSVKKYALTRANVYSTQVVASCQQGKNGLYASWRCIVTYIRYIYDKRVVSHETPSTATRKIAYTSLFEICELTVLQSLPKAQRDTIIAQRIKRTEQAMLTAIHPELKEEKVMIQKQGEPNWKEVEHDAKIAFGKKMISEG